MNIRLSTEHLLLAAIFVSNPYARNRYIVQQADLLLACFDGQEGGTKNTVEYARRFGCPVCLIPPVKTPKSA